MKRALPLLVLLAACKSEPAPAPAPEKTAPAAPAAPAPVVPAWERDNPIAPLPKAPLGTQADFSRLRIAVTPAKVRLGRWLFFDKRLSADGTVACASCHRPENAFSEPTPHSTGIKGQQGARKAPTFVNGAWPLFDVYFWDGRAASLVEQAKGPVANPLEMGNTHEACAKSIAAIAGYRRAFREVYGDDRIDMDRIAEAIAAYEATRLSGNSAYDRFDAGDAHALDAEAAKGRELFFGKAQCNQCHLGWNFTDSQFHNLGIGWDAKAKKLADRGRAIVTHKPEDEGAFKTPTLRDVTKHAPYMHDGSLATLTDVVEHYNNGGNPNPWLDKKIFKLHLTKAEVADLVAFLHALDGEGYADAGPKSFPS